MHGGILRGRALDHHCKGGGSGSGKGATREGNRGKLCFRDSNTKSRGQSGRNIGATKEKGEEQEEQGEKEEETVMDGDKGLGKPTVHFRDGFATSKGPKS